jgi:hypothetical protein
MRREKTSEMHGYLCNGKRRKTIGNTMGDKKKVNYPVWVNGQRFNGIEAAAFSAGKLFGKAVDAAWLSNKLREHGSIKVHGILISVLGPKGSSDVESEIIKGTSYREANRGRLLNFPPGEEIINRGICRVRR